MREEHDFYPTPLWVTRRLLERLDIPEGLRWLEPAVGDGAIVEAVTESNVVGHFVCNDIRRSKTFEGECQASGWDLTYLSYLSHYYSPREFDVAITNPPFSLANEFALKMRRDAASSLLLVRLSFLGSQKRAWLADDMPDVYVLPNRPSFVNGRTDNSEYCWLHWPGPSKRKAGLVARLADTPKEER